MKELSFIIDGRPMSKKRNWTIVTPHGRSPRIVLTKRYKEWEKGVLDQLWVQRMQYQASMTGPWEPIAEPVQVTFIFYIRKKGKYDLSNLYQGIEDALEKSQILEDDSLIESHDGSRKHIGDEADQILIRIRPFKEVRKNAAK